MCSNQWKCAKIISKKLLNSNKIQNFKFFFKFSMSESYLLCKFKYISKWICKDKINEHLPSNLPESLEFVVLKFLASIVPVWT